MGRQVTDITKPWKRPNPMEGSPKTGIVPLDKRRQVKNLGKGRVVAGVPWKKPENAGKE